MTVGNVIVQNLMNNLISKLSNELSTDSNSTLLFGMGHDGRTYFKCKKIEFKFLAFIILLESYLATCNRKYNNLVGNFVMNLINVWNTKAAKALDTITPN